MATAVLKLHCEDTKGIVYHVAKFIFEHGGNILESQQHQEPLNNRFFMRVHFDLADLNCTRQQLRSDWEPVSQKFNMETDLTFSDDRKRIAIMVSKYDHCLYDLFLRHQYGELNADIALVVSNHPDLESVSFNFKVPYFYIPVTKANKQEAEQKAVELFRQHQVDLIALARYMQILTPTLLEAYPNRIINVHHGFLPAFVGAKPYHQAYEKGVKMIGATSHYATEELDMGPIIEQETIRVTHAHDPKDMVRLGRDIEKKVFAHAVKQHLEDRIIVYKNRTIIFD